MNPVVTFEHVTKIFEHQGSPSVRAVHDLSLSVSQGEIFTLVGPDGAGKSTILRMMCGVLKPSQGTITVVGLDMKRNRDEIKHHIGYLSQRFTLYPDLTVSENIDFFAEIHRVKAYRERKEELLGFTRLSPFRDRLAEHLSGGMKQKLALACTLIHRPDVIFLDEPTTGVDPVSRRDFWKILADILKSGITIIMSTPYLDEAERSSRIALINKGEIFMCDTPERVRNSFKQQVVELLCDDARNAQNVLRNLSGVHSVHLFGDRLHVVTGQGESLREKILEGAKKGGIQVQSYRTIAPSLEDVFISHLTT